jgi:predicted nucleic acid-binding protein
VVFVLEASVATTWAFDDESDPISDAARDLMSSEAAVVPSSWWYEVRNAALVGERRGRLKPAETAYFLAQLADLPVETVSEINEAMAFRLARDHHLTFYDACYLALASDRDIPLATLDRALIAASPREGVQLIGAR